MRSATYPTIGQGAPSFEDLEAMARSRGILIGRADLPFGLFIHTTESWPGFQNMARHVPAIILPERAGRKTLTWELALMLGHSILGHRPGLKPRLLMEIEANHWAKKALSAGLDGIRRPA